MGRVKFSVLHFCAILLIQVMSCSKSDKITENSPVKTDKGAVLGESVNKTIGTDGGSITSLDGNLSIDFPIGALTSSMDISIQPITNEAPLGLGLGYRLLPEGTTFLKPVKLTFHFNNDLLDGVPSDFLWIVTQASDGSWNAALHSYVDKDAGTVTVEAKHFSDWALGKFIDFVLVPSFKTILKGQSVQLELVGFSRNGNIEEEDLAPLPAFSKDGFLLEPLTPIPPVEARIMNFKVKQWTLNGVATPVSNTNGSLTASGLTAIYTAPSTKVPAVNPVAVTVQLESNNKEGKKGNYYITSNIKVLEAKYFINIKIDKDEYLFTQYGFDENIPDANNTTMVNCGVDNNVLNINALRMENNNLMEQFEFFLSSPGLLSRKLDGENPGSKDDITFLSLNAPYFVYEFAYPKRTYDAAAQKCNEEDLYNDITVTILTYDTKTGELQGSLTGIVHSSSTNDDVNNCRTPEEHSFYADFRLIMSNYYLGN